MRWKPGLWLVLLALGCADEEPPYPAVDKLAPRDIECRRSGDSALVISDGFLVEVNRASGKISHTSSLLREVGPEYGKLSMVRLRDDERTAIVTTDDLVLEVPLPRGESKLLYTRPPSSELSDRFTDLTLSDDGLRGYASTYGRGVVELDLVTGVLRQLASAGSEEPWAPEMITITQRAMRAWVGWRAKDFLLELDLATGSERRVDAISSVEDLALAEDGSTLYWLGTNSGSTGGGAISGLYRVDPTTGTATMISDSSRGSGPSFLTPQRFCLAEARREAWVLDTNAQRLVIVNLDSGDRTELLSWQ